MIPHYHPRAEWLLSYVAGALDDAQAVVIAAHVAHCLLCQKQVAAGGAVATALFETVSPISPGPQCFDRIMQRLDQGPQPDRHQDGITTKTAGKHGDDRSDLPDIVQQIFDRHKLGRSFDAMPWQFISTGLQGIELSAAHGDSGLWLLKCKGSRCAGYDYHGDQLSLILTGSYVSNDRHFRVGDMDEADDAVMHRPRVIDGEDCIFLAAVSDLIPGKSFLPNFLQRLFG